MLGQYTHSWASSFVFSMPMWFVCNWLSICSFKLLGIMIHLPLSIMPSFTASSSLYDQYSCKSACSLSLLSGQPEITIPFNCCRWLSSDDACCISGIDTHSVYLSWFVLHPPAFPCPLLVYPSLLCGYVSIASLQWKSQGQVCIWSGPCIGRFLIVCTVCIVIMWPHLF